MTFLRTLSALAATVALATAAPAATLTGQKSGNVFTFVLTGTPVASLHVYGGQQTGENNGSTTEPAPWAFTGSLFEGNYEWEAPQNRSGTFTFTVNHSVSNIPLPTKAQYDYFDSTGSRVLADIPIAPVPEPSALLALGLPTLALLRRRRSD